MATPKKIIIKDLELADKEIARLRKELKKYKDKDVLDIIRWSEKLREENEELKEHKANLIRADKKKTEYIDELEKQKIEKKLLFVLIGVFIGIVIAVICYSHDLENMCLRLFNS